MNKALHAAVLVLGLSWAAATSAEAVLSPEPGITATIDAQIGALLNDDFDGAFTYASPGIQGLFGDSERFGQMVRNGYPMVWRPAEVHYLALREVAGALWQRVLIRDQAGGVHLLDYQMVQVDGNWRINGVHILQQPDIGA